MSEPSGQLKPSQAAATGLHRFVPAQQAALPKDLVQLKTTIGGTAGALHVGTQVVANVLMVGQGLYVTTEKVPRVIEVAMALDRADIHVLRGGADLAQFVERYTAFSHE